MTQIIDKPWGSETILTEADLPYTGKILEIKSGCRFSLQYHDQKIETLVLLSGQATIILDDTQSEMSPFTPYTIKPPTKHRIIAQTDTKVLEISTPETGNTVRLEDDYDRTTETPEIRNLPNRGWSPNGQ